MQEFFHQQYVLGVVLDFFSRCIDFDHLSITKKHLWHPNNFDKGKCSWKSCIRGKKTTRYGLQNAWEKTPVIVLWMFGRYLSAQFFLCPKRSHLQIPLWKTSMSPEHQWLEERYFLLKQSLFRARSLVFRGCILISQGNLEAAKAHGAEVTLGGCTRKIYPRGNGD